MRASLAACLGLLLLAGCTGSSHQPVDQPSAAFQQALFEGEANAGTPAGHAGSHGTPQRDDSSVETGMSATNVPGAYARRTVNITNDFGGADLGLVELSVEAGSIEVSPGGNDGYTITAVLEAHGLTEQDAKDALDRLELTHTDQLQSDGLHLTTVVKEKPAQQAIPFVQLGGAWTWADLQVKVPAGPAYQLAATSSAGGLRLEGLRGPSFKLSTSSGDLDVGTVNAGTLSVDTSSGDVALDTVAAERVEADVSSGQITAKDVKFGAAKLGTSSGDITLAGLVDTLSADTSSGSIKVDAHGLASGAYKLSASSGDIDLRLLSGEGHAYHVRADTSSGKVTVQLADSETISDKDDHAEAVTRGFDGAAIRTVVDAETSSGDISVQG